MGVGSNAEVSNHEGLEGANFTPVPPFDTLRASNSGECDPIILNKIRVICTACAAIVAQQWCSSLRDIHVSKLSMSTESEEVAPGIVLDFDERNQVIGIEINEATLDRQGLMCLREVCNGRFTPR